MSKTKISITQFLFYVFWTLLLIGKGLGMTSANPAMVTFTWVAIFFAIFKMLLSKWKKRN